MSYMEKSVKKIKLKFKRGIAFLLVICMLPLSSFPAGATPEESTSIVGNRKTEEKKTEETISVSADETEPVTAETTEPEPEKNPYTDPAISANSIGDMTISGNWVLEEDTIVDELVIHEGTVDLNGHTLVVCENLIHEDGSLWASCGDLIIWGDYRMQKRVWDDQTETYVYEESEAKLSVIWDSSDSSYIYVGGDIYVDSVYASNNRLNGVLELKGSLYQEECENAIGITGHVKAKKGLDFDWSHELILSGEEKQIIQWPGERTSNQIGKLTIRNKSEEGVVFERQPLVYVAIDMTRDEKASGKLRIYDSVEFPNNYFCGDLVATDYSSVYIDDALEINGDFYLAGGYVYVDENLHIRGDMIVTDAKDGGWVYFNWRSNSLCIDGDIDASQLQKKWDMYVYGNGISSSDFCLKGDFCGEKVYLNIDDITAEFSGDFTVSNQPDASQYTYVSTNNTKLIFNGKEKQTVDMGTCKDRFTFGVIESRNTSEEGVHFSDIVYVDKLESNDNNVYFGGLKAAGGRTLSEDLCIEEDIVFMGKGWDLNGHEISCKENLTVGSGLVSINGGKLSVSGNCIVDALGIISMTQKRDRVEVDGDMTFQSRFQTEGKLTNGVLTVHGNFSSLSLPNTGNSFIATDQHITQIARKDYEEEKVQKIILENDQEEPFFATLRICSPQEEYYEYDGDIIATAKTVEPYLFDNQRPTVVTGLHAQSIGMYDAVLAYDPSFDARGIKCYEIWRDGVKIGETEDVTYKDTGLTLETEYTYEVYAINIDGAKSLIPTELTIKTTHDTQPPSRVSGIKLTRRTGSSIGFSWSAAYDNCGVTGYNVYRDDVLVVKNKKWLSYTEYDLEPNTCYTYEITALDEKGNESVRSTFLAETKLINISGIYSNEGSVITGDTFSITVSLGTDFISDYKILRLEYYDEQREEWSSCYSNWLAQSEYSHTFNADISHINKDDDVRFKVMLKDYDGNTSEKEVIFHVDRLGPAAPDVVMAEENNAKVTLTWSQSEGEDCSHYIIYRKKICENGNATAEAVGTVSETGEQLYSYVDTTVEQNCTYAYYVRALDHYNNYFDSKQIQVDVNTDLIPPSAATDIYVRRSTGSAITVEWEGATDNNGVYSYSLYRDDVLIAENIKQTYYKDFGTDLDAGLQQYTIYHYKVKAFDKAGNESKFSPETEAALVMPKIRSVLPQDQSVIGGEDIVIRVDFEYTQNCYQNVVDLKWYDTISDTWIAINETPIPPDRAAPWGAYMCYKWVLPKLGGSVDKSIDVLVTLRDEDGNETEKIVTYTIDVSGPSAPKNVAAEEDDSVVIVRWDASATADAQGYYVYRKSTEEEEYTLLSKVEGRFSGWYQDKEVETGKTYSYCVSAYDEFSQEGEKSSPADITVQTSDQSAPKISNMTPAAGKVSGLVNIRAEGSDNRGMKAIEFYIRENADMQWELLESAQAMQNAASFIWDTRNHTDGDYYIKAVAKDTAGNESQELFQRRYRVDNTGISRIVLSQCRSFSNSIRLTWKDVTEPDFAYFSVEYKTEHENETLREWKEIAKVKDRLGYDVMNLKPDHAYTFRVVGYDTMGNKGIYSEEITITTQSDTSAPVIQKISPVSSYYGDSVSLELLAADNADLGMARFSYALDGKNFQVLSEPVAPEGKKEWNYTYLWDTSNLPEGDIVVRFEVYDKNGLHNRTEDETHQYEVTYTIDHTAPLVPTGVVASGTDGCANLYWEIGKEKDLKEYIVYRSDVKDGTYEQINSLRTNAMNDTSAEQGKTYYYKISVMDIAGNESAMTAPVKVIVMPDEIKPVVTGIGPVEKKVLGINPTIEFLAYDNKAIVRYRVEYRKKDESAWTQICTQEIEEKDEYNGKITWNTEGLEDGAIYEIRVMVSDKAGNESDPVIAEYSLDLTPPKAPVLTAKPGSFCIVLNGKTEDPDDVSAQKGYELWRRAYGSSEYEFVKGLVQPEYQDESVQVGKIYYYKLRVYDENGNYSESEPVYSHASDTDTVAPVSVLPEVVMAVTGSEFEYDGTLSTDNVRVVSYAWDFGDGTKATGAKTTHSYKRPGNYTMTLTTADAAGNTNTTHTTVTVKDMETHGRSVVRVLASDGSPIAGAQLYINTDGTKEGTIRSKTNDLGEAVVVANPGEYTVAAFADGYLPKETGLCVELGTETKTEIFLPSGEIVTGELTFERMELEDMLEAGVDLSDPSNYNTFSYSVTFAYEEKPIPVVVQGKAYRTFSYIREAGVSHGGSNLGVYKSGGSNGEIEIICKEEETEEGEIKVEPVTLIYMTVAESVSWLQDMYNVNLSVDNHADSGFVLENATATLDIPDGLALAVTKTGQKKEIQLGDIDGQQSASASWIVRGTKQGSFPIGASFSANMQPFDVPITRYFASEKEIEVPAGAGLDILVQPEDIAVAGEAYYVKFTISNNSDRTFYNFKTKYVQEGEGRSSLPVSYVDPETCEEMQLDNGTEPMNYVFPDGNNGNLAAIVKNGDSIEIGNFAPGEQIVSYFMGAIAPSDNEHYLELVDSFVQTLEGANLGVSVRVAPMQSHAQIPQIVVTQEEPETYGDPVDVTTGAFLQEINAFAGGGDSLFDLVYDSTKADKAADTGYGWSHSFDQRIIEEDGKIILCLGNGQEMTFISEAAKYHRMSGTSYDGSDFYIAKATRCDRAGVGSYVPATDDTLGQFIVKSRDGDIYSYVLTDAEGTKWYFDHSKQVIRRETKDGVEVTYERSKDMTRITNQLTQESVTLIYDEAGRLIQACDGNQREILLTYDETGNITSFTDEEGSVTQFYYDDNHHMCKGVGPTGIVMFENTFDEKGRILTQAEAGSTLKSSFIYSEDIKGIGKTTIRKRDGSEIAYTYNERGAILSETNELGATTSYQYNSSGELLRRVEPDGSTTGYVYDEGGRLLCVQDPEGNNVSFTYDVSGNTTGIQGADTGTGTFAYDEKGRMTQSFSALGMETDYRYDAYGNAVKETVPGLGSRTFTYEKGRKTSETDRLGNTIRYMYDSYGNTVTTVDPLGNMSSSEYDEMGRPVYAEDPLGREIYYDYDELGRLLCETVDGRETSYEYDDAGRVVLMTDALGWETSYTYDVEGNLLATTYPDGTKAANTYDAAGRLTETLQPDGSTYTYKYDQNSRRIAESINGLETKYTYYKNGKTKTVTNPDGTSVTYTYDQDGNLSSATDQDGNKTTHTYDSAGNLTKTTDALGNSVTYSYDVAGRLITKTDANGNTEHYTYDANGNCISMTNAEGTKYRMTYDALGRMTKVSVDTGERTLTSQYKYDAAGRVIAYINAAGNRMTITYDTFGNITKMTDAEGNTIEQAQYDDMNRLIKSIDALGNETTNSYDASDNLTKTVSATGAVTTYEYDAAGRLTKSTDAEGGTVLTGYTQNGDVAARTDAAYGTTKYSYDALARVTSVTSAIGATESYTYNAQGLLAEKENAKGQKTTYTYDALGRISSRTDEIGTIRYTYDPNGNILTVSEEQGLKKQTITRTYDAMNRVTSVTDYNGNTVKYGYDELGNRISITYPGGEIVRYTYDACGNMLTATDAAGKTTRYTYDKNGRIIRQTRPDGSAETRTYDAAGQLTEQKDVAVDGSIIHHIKYTYDEVGNIVEKSGTTNGDSNRHTSVTMTYDADNRLITYNGEKVTYDAEGNMLHGPLDGEMADYTYDCRNRLIKVTTAETTTEYRYDAEDVRTEEYITDEKSGNTYRKVYVTDRETTYSQLLTETIQEKNSLGIYETTETKTYTYGIGLLSEQSDSTKQTLYYHFDNLGSTTEITTEAGKLKYRFAYDTYGKLTGIYQGNTNMLTQNGQQKTVSEVLRETGIRFLYNGEFGVQTDTNSLYYMRARYYNPVIRRFINRDIVEGTPAESQSLNRYAYAQGNPVNQLDPFGLSPQNPYSKAHSFLDFLGLFWSGADVANALLYMAEGDMKNAALSLMCALPVVGIAVAVGVKGVIKAGKLLTKTASFVKKFAKAQNIAEATTKFGKKASKTKQALANIVKKATKKASKVAGEAAEAAKSSAKTTVNVAEEVGKGASKSGSSATNIISRSDTKPDFIVTPNGTAMDTSKNYNLIGTGEKGDWFQIHNIGKSEPGFGFPHTHKPQMNTDGVHISYNRVVSNTSADDIDYADILLRNGIMTIRKGKR